MLAASCRTGTIKVRQSIWSNAHHGDPTRHDRYNRVKGTRSPWVQRREKRRTIRRNSRRIDRQHAFPIVPPSPHAASSFRGLSTRAATSWQARSRSGPHRKTFRKPVIRCVAHGGLLCEQRLQIDPTLAKSVIGSKSYLQRKAQQATALRYVSRL